MNVKLLYPNRNHSDSEAYFDWNEIVKDLGLDVLFRVSRKDSALGLGASYTASQEYENLSMVVKRVMAVCVPEDVIRYRHEILKDCLKHESFTLRLYVICQDTIAGWDRLGRNKKRSESNDSSGGLTTDIEVLRLIFDGMSKIKALFRDYAEDIKSAGLKNLHKRIEDEFSDDKEKNLEKVLDDLSFFAVTKIKEIKRNVYESTNPVIVLDVGFGDGLKFTDLKLDEFASKTEAYRNPNSLASRLSNRISKFRKQTIPIRGNQGLEEDALKFEKETVGFVMTCMKNTINEYGGFIDRLRFEAGFYFGAINLKNEMRRFNIGYCFPEIGSFDTLEFKDLKEISMAISQRRDTVGNTDNLDGKILTVITGANQGGKSTFLRSVGIAQIMMQCGMFVAADSYKSGLFPKIFTHFTRREDSAMNSGKLDEELKRMGRIVDNVTPGSLVLLNESFATTTEKEGSGIAYDIVKALKECGVKVMTVTHLMSFARRMYEECGGSKSPDSVFLSAERLENGARTYKMIRHEPELSSFGMELYEKIIEKENDK